jgi:hypothetical protein
MKNLRRKPEIILHWTYAPKKPCNIKGLILVRNF